MEVLAIIATALRGLSILTANPLLGGGGNVKVSEAAELMNMLATLVGEGATGMAELKAFAEQIDAMAKENRAPTPAEWDALRARSDAAHASIQEAAAEIRNEDPTPPPEPEPEDPQPE